MKYEKKKRRKPKPGDGLTSEQKSKLHSASLARNQVALNPLLTKASVHEKTVKAKRRANKVALKKTWFERGAVIAASGQSHVSQNLTIAVI